MPSPSQHEADFSKGGPGFREDLRAACAVPHVVGRAVLGDKFDLLKLRVCSEQARPYLVDQMLYRAAVELMEGALAACRPEEDVARAALARGRVQRHLARGDAERLHDRVGFQELAAEEGAQTEEVSATVFGRHRVHEVLHRVGGDDLAIVAMCVRGEEALSDDVDVDRRGERRHVLTAEPVENDVRLPVADLGRGHDLIRVNRSRVIARNSSIPVASSSSRVRRRRARNTGTILAFGRPATNTTNRNPNLCSYSSFSDARSRNVATSAPPACSRRESVESDAGSAPIRG